MADSGINEHKRLAMGQTLEGETKGGRGDFGVEPCSDCSLPHPDRDVIGGHLRDHERAAAHPQLVSRSGYAAQAMPDHGPVRTSGMSRESKGMYHRGQQGTRGR